jgi:ParB/RepB/Spo0J family partition protein
MNAPEKIATVESIALDLIVPSTTHIQELRRSRFDPKLIAELAESIKAVGVLQPVLVRRSQANGRVDKFELVAGERRWRAAKLAGLTEIHATVKALSDEQVLEVQLIENLQREGLHELEEAEGYEELMKLKQVPAEALADMVGKSESYVRARVKLLALCPEGRKAFYAGEMDASTALLIARIPHEDLQKEAMKELADRRSYGDVSNYKDAARFIHENFMLQLKAAPFKLDDAALVPAAGSCLKCPKRTGNQRELFAEVGKADLCIDTKCFGEKRLAAEKLLVNKYEEQGKTILTGDDARRILPYGDDHAQGGHYVLTQTCYEDPKQRKYSELVDEADVKHVQSPRTGRIVKVVHASAVAKALAAKGIKTAREKAKAKKAGVGVYGIDRRVLQILHDKKILDATAMRVIARAALVDFDAGYGMDEHGDDLEKIWGWKPGTLTKWGQRDPLPKEVAALDVSRLQLFVLELAVAQSMDHKGTQELLKARGIDRKKVEQQLKDEAKKAAAEKKEAASKKGKK